MGIIGTADERQEPNPPERADQLAEITLPDHEGTEHRLADFWENGPAILVWLRHYG